MEHDVRRLEQVGHIASRAQKREVLFNSILRDKLLDVFRFVSAD